MPAPRTYDEIIAKTVPDPDSSFRPTEKERDEALARVIPPDDEVLATKVEEVLSDLGAAHLSFDIDGSRVTLRGSVSDLPTWRRIDAAVSSIPGVGSLDNRTHLG